VNIYFVCNIDLGRKSATYLQVTQYAEMLAKLGNDVTLFAPKFEGTIEGVRIVKIPCGPFLYLGRILYQSLLPIILTYHILVRRPDCVLVKHSIANVGFFLPVVLLGVPFFLRVDAEPIEEIELDARYVPSLYLYLFDCFQRLAFHKACAVAVPHPAVKRKLISDYDLKPEAVVVIGNGVDTKLFQPVDQDQARLTLQLDASLKYLIFVGNVLPWHGVEYIIQAVPHLKQLRSDFQILVVGDGPALSDVIELTDELAARDNVCFVGRVPREQVPTWLGAADICLLPSKMIRSHPGDPIKMYEYMACGKPILAADVEGYGDFVERNRLGISVDFTYSERLAAAMDDLLLKDLSTYCENNRNLAVNNYRWKHIVEKINELLQAECAGH